MQLDISSYQKGHVKGILKDKRTKKENRIVQLRELCDDTRPAELDV